jgi:hypothetical protein
LETPVLEQRLQGWVLRRLGLQLETPVLEEKPLDWMRKQVFLRSRE